MTDRAAMRDQVLAQLRVPMTPLERILAWPFERQMEWATKADRRLWGASVVMSNALGLRGRAPSALTDEDDPLEHAWADLYRLIEKVREAWPDDIAMAHATERNQQRRATYEAVMAKLQAQGAIGAPSQTPKPAEVVSLAATQAEMAL